MHSRVCVHKFPALSELTCRALWFVTSPPEWFVTSQLAWQLFRIVTILTIIFWFHTRICLTTVQLKLFSTFKWMIYLCVCDNYGVWQQLNINMYKTINIHTLSSTFKVNCSGRQQCVISSLGLPSVLVKTDFTGYFKISTRVFVVFTGVSTSLSSTATRRPSVQVTRAPGITFAKKLPA